MIHSHTSLLHFHPNIQPPTSNPHPPSCLSWHTDRAMCTEKLKVSKNYYSIRLFFYLFSQIKYRGRSKLCWRRESSIGERTKNMDKPHSLYNVLLLWMLVGVLMTQESNAEWCPSLLLQARESTNHRDRYYRVTRDRENWNWKTTMEYESIQVYAGCPGCPSGASPSHNIIY